MLIICFNLATHDDGTAQRSRTLILLTFLGEPKMLAFTKVEYAFRYYNIFAFSM